MSYNYSINSRSEILGGYHMITAAQAREKINALETERGDQERKIVEEKITKALEDLDH